MTEISKYSLIINLDSLLPEALQQIIVGIIFLAGAIFVVIVINLFFKVIQELGL